MTILLNAQENIKKAGVRLVTQDSARRLELLLRFLSVDISLILCVGSRSQERKHILLDLKANLNLGKGLKLNLIPGKNPTLNPTPGENLKVSLSLGRGLKVSLGPGRKAEVDLGPGKRLKAKLSPGKRPPAELNLGVKVALIASKPDSKNLVALASPKK